MPPAARWRFISSFDAWRRHFHLTCNSSESRVFKTNALDFFVTCQSCFSPPNIYSQKLHAQICYNLRNYKTCQTPVNVATNKKTLGRNRGLKSNINFLYTHLAVSPWPWQPGVFLFFIRIFLENNPYCFEKIYYLLIIPFKLPAASQIRPVPL